jgi:DNA polymerase
VDALKALADEAVERANIRLRELSNGAIEAVTNVKGIVRWLEGAGVLLDDLTKQSVSEALNGDLPDDAREVLEIRRDVGKTSVAKLVSMLCYASGVDDRARGLLLYHGASTGRWAGMGIQPQNFPRGSVKDPERLIPLVMAGDYDALEAEAPIMEIVSSLLRACFIAAPNARLVGGDFSAIEGHITAWLAGQDGMTSYEEMAAEIFGISPDEVENPSFERHVGKTAVLGCGYGMGWKKFQTTVYDWTGTEISKETAHLAVDTYRKTNWQIKRLWAALESAAVRAVARPGLVQTAGRNDSIRFVVRGEYLWCGLPSGRLLAYALPRLEDRLAPWGELKKAVTFSGMNSVTKKWERRDLYGGLLTENVVQATARDLMAEAMLRVEQHGYPVVLTVHDEILAEMPDGVFATSFDMLMAETPAWGSQIPVLVEWWEGKRFRK